MANLKIFESEPVFAADYQQIQKIHEGAAAFLKNHPAVADVRKIGTMAAVELPARTMPGYFSEAGGGDSI